jgi:uncharacterized protein YceH (UPF0502 family)
VKFNKPAAIVILFCAVAIPAWSGVPHAIQRTETSNVQVAAAKSPVNDACARMAALENEMASLRSRVDDMLAQLRARGTDGK